LYKDECYEMLSGVDVGLALHTKYKHTDLKTERNKKLKLNENSAVYGCVVMRT